MRYPFVIIVLSLAISASAQTPTPTATPSGCCDGLYCLPTDQTTCEAEGGIYFPNGDCGSQHAGACNSGGIADCCTIHTCYLTDDQTTCEVTDEGTFYPTGPFDCPWIPNGGPVGGFCFAPTPTITNTPTVTPTNTPTPDTIGCCDTSDVDACGILGIPCCTSAPPAEIDSNTCVSQANGEWHSGANWVCIGDIGEGASGSCITVTPTPTPTETPTETLTPTNTRTFTITPTVNATNTADPASHGRATHYTALEETILKGDYDLPQYSQMCVDAGYNPPGYDICRCVLYFERVGGVISWNARCPDGTVKQITTVP